MIRWLVDCIGIIRELHLSCLTLRLVSLPKGIHQSFNDGECVGVTV